MNNSQTTLCYIEQDNKYLMMHRIKKEHDLNKDKWVGVGGHLEQGESPEQCLLREVKEETGLTLISWKFCGIVTFTCDSWDMTEYMYLYKGFEFEGDLQTCDEGTLEWIDKKDIYSLPIWEGDKIFFRLMDEQEEFFSLKLSYKGDALCEVLLNGKPYNN